MAVSSTSSISSALGVTGKGIGGLATGLNTDELVAALTSGTKSKIAKQGQQKQLLNWKMNAYRSMATALNAFQTKYLKVSTSAASNTNITASKFFNTYKATSSSDKVSVSATSGSITGNFTIDKVTQLATSESFTSAKKMSTTLSMNINEDSTFSSDFTGQTLKLEVDGFSTKTIKLDSMNSYLKDNGDGTYSIDDFGDFKAGLQKLMNEAYKSTGVISVDAKDGGNITLDSSSARITVNTTNSLLGLDAGDSNRVDTGTKIGALDAFKNVQGDVLTFNINGKEISVSKDDTIDTLLGKVANSGADVRMEYDQYNDVFTLTSKKTGADSVIEMHDVHGNLLNEIFGAKSGTGLGTGTLTTGDEIVVGSDFFSKINGMNSTEKKELLSKLSNMSFNLTVNGVSKKVAVDISAIDSTKRNNGTFNSDDVYKAINKGIQSAFYNSGIEFGRMTSGKTVIETTKGEAFDISASGEFAKLLGLSEDGSTFSAGNTVKDFGFSGQINSSTIDSALSNANGFLDVTKLNITSANPGVFEMTINGVTKTVTVTPGVDDNGNAIAVTNDNFLSRLNTAVKEAFGNDAADVSFSATYDKMPGYYQALDPNNYDHDLYELRTDGEGKSWFYEKGTDNKFADDQGLAVDAEGNKIDAFPKTIGVKLTLNVAANSNNAVETSVSMNGTLANSMGFVSGAHNSAATTNTIKLSELNGGKYVGSGTITIGTQATNEDGSPKVDVDGNAVIEYKEANSFTYNENTNINDLINQINTQFKGQLNAGIKDGKLFINSLSDTIRIQDKADPYTAPGPEDDGYDPNYNTNTERGLLANVFGISGGQFETKAENYTKVDANGNPVLDEDGNAVSTRTEGVNSIVTIDGRRLEQSTNTISYNGVSITLNDTTLNASGVHEPIKIGVQADPDDVVTRIQDWMDNYNALVYTLNSALNEGKNRDYSPLTDEQKADMTEDQIKTWETEAKKGLLRNDQTLRQILADMRKSLYERVESAGISLYDIGIVTKSSLSDPNQSGQLEFDTNITGGGEARLREMLTNNPDSVRMLFTDSENGIGAKLNDIISKAANPSSVDRGTLVRIAGTEQLTGDNTSQLGTKITALDKYIAALKSRLETEYNRYWKQFSSLETSVQKMNTQSSWLSGQ